MRAAEICKLLDRANRLRELIGVGPGEPLPSLHDRPPGANWYTFQARRKKVAEIEQEAARLVADGLGRRTKNKKL